MTIPNRTINSPPRDPRERAAWVQFQLRLRGLTCADIARAEGVTARAIRQALYLASQYLEKAIAKAIDLTPQELFPERFDESGRRLHRSRPKHRNAASNQSNNQLHRAA